MPSPTERTWPTSATSASVPKLAICCLRMAEISAARISILGNPLHGELQTLQLAADGRIEQARADLDDEAAQDLGFYARIDGNFGAAQHRAQRIAELLQLLGRQRNGRRHGRRGLATTAGEFGEERCLHGDQVAGAAVCSHRADEAA